MTQKDTAAGDFAATLYSIPKDLSNIPCRIVPSSFNPDDPDLRPFPLPLTWRWESCAMLLKHFDTEVVMSQLPLFWQLAAPLQTAAQEAGAAFYFGDVENMPVNAVAIHQEMDTVVISAHDALRFLKYLIDEVSPLPTSWILIHTPSALVWDFPEVLREDVYQVGQEIHLIPGVPLLYQSPALADEKQSRFLLSKEFEWDITETGTFISSHPNHIVPFHRLRLPFLLRAVANENGTVVVEKRV